jgi:coproporphyrinogen III oxidase-like Fe-S oxidoreductase
MVVVEREFDKVVEKHSETIHKYKGVLEGFIKDHPEVHPDLIYIDACHTYEGCKNDLINALKLNPKAISGHDYTASWPGVVKAVDEVVGKPDMTFCDGSWIKRLS